MSMSEALSAAGSPARPVRVGIVGSRGIPNRYGGFERFVEQLVASPEWNDGQFHFVVYGENPPTNFNAVTVTRQVPARKSKSPLEYCGRATQMAVRECDVVLALGVGISFFSILPRLSGKPLVINPDGVEWKRSKWSALGRIALRALYYPALFFADRIVIDAEALRSDFPKFFSHKMTYIAYPAVQPVGGADQAAALAGLGIDGPFLLVIARLEPENHIAMIVEAFAQAGRADQTLIIVGATNTRYFNGVLGNQRPLNVRYLGAIFDQTILNALRARCAAYIHGHSVGGTNPSLLEALVCVNGSLFCHDNKYNREVAGERARYFCDARQLSELMGSTHLDAPDAGTPEALVDERFRPGNIAAKYREVLRELVLTRR